MEGAQLVKYGSKQIHFHLQFKERKSLGIQVNPSGNVDVIAPMNTLLEDIKYKVHKKASWIIKQQTSFYKYNPKTPNRKYINGETHLYLGRQYLLNIVLTSKTECSNYVKLQRGKMNVYTHTKTPLIVENIITNYYTERAIIIFNELFHQVKPLHKKFNHNEIRMTIKKMEKRWGSCSQTGKIILNTELIKTPKACIEYVIIHELCHMVYFHHQKPFYALLAKFCPDWERRKGKLEMLMA
jgi:predicted metal-dependent hydrolase